MDHLNKNLQWWHARQQREKGEFLQQWLRKTVVDATIFDMDENAAMELVRQNPYFILRVAHPSEAVQLEAVNKDGRVIVVIQHPSEAVKLAAVHQAGEAVGFIENPSEEVKWAAVQQNAFALFAIEEVSDKLVEAALEKNGMCIAYLSKDRIPPSFRPSDVDPFADVDFAKLEYETVPLSELSPEVRQDMQDMVDGASRQGINVRLA